jgi:GTP diphosphokinase / guanosine-3',5'-bis(diphosphate) 3'-diphosphatase
MPNQTEGRDENDDTSVTVVGMKGMLTTFARCCKPLPGDEIAGYITRGRGVTIHRQDCPNILRSEDRERIIKVSWGIAPKTYPVPVVIKAYDRQGLMGDISKC